MPPKPCVASPPPAPSAPPLSPAWNRDDDGLVSAVDVYALPLARPVPSSPPPLPPPPPPRTSVNEWHVPSTGTTGTRNANRLYVQSEGDCCPSVWSALWFAAHLAAYHIANVSLAFVACLVIVVGLALSLALLPLCGVGVAFFSTTLRCAYYLADIDARFHNTIVASDRDQIAFAADLERRPLLPLRDPPPPLPHWRFATDELQRPTPRAVALLVYFAVVKPVLGLLSAVGLTLVITCSWALVSDKFHISISVDEPAQMAVDTAAWTPVECFVTAVIAAIGLHVVARVAMAATRYACCERV